MVIGLKHAIAAALKLDFAALSLKLFLAKKNDGAWLTECEAEALRTADGLTPLAPVFADLRRVGSSDEDIAVDVDEAAVGNVPIHVFVRFPVSRTIVRCVAALAQGSDRHTDLVSVQAHVPNLVACC